MAGKPLPEQGRAEASVVRRSSLGWTAMRFGGNAGPRWMAVALTGTESGLPVDSPTLSSAESAPSVPDDRCQQGEDQQG